MLDSFPIQQMMESTVFNWVIFPILIFFSRVCDVTIGTIRIIFVSRSKRLLAPILGFFEVLIWIIAITQIMQNLNNWFYYIAYAGGFAMGNYVGIIVEEKLALGTLIVRVFLVNDDHSLRDCLYQAGFGVTSMDACGMNGNIKIIYTVVKRKDLDQVIEIIEKCNAKAFYSIEEVKDVKQGIFPQQPKTSLIQKIFAFPYKRKGSYRRQGK